MKVAKKYAALMLPAFIAVFLASAIAQNSDSPSSVPPIPSAYYGYLTISGIPAPDGLEMKAYINGIECSQPSETKNGMYSVVVRGNDQTYPGCGEEGDKIELFVSYKGKELKLAEFEWHSGSITRQDIDLKPKNTGINAKIIAKDKTPKIKIKE